MIKKYSILIVLCLCIGKVVFSQENITKVKIDLDKKTINPSILPFDRPIFLEITSKTNPLSDSLYIYTIKTHKGLKYFGDPLNSKKGKKYLEYLSRGENSLFKAEKEELKILQEKFATRAINNPTIKILKKDVKKYLDYLDLSKEAIPDPEKIAYNKLLKEFKTAKQNNSVLIISRSEVEKYLRFINYGQFKLFLLKRDLAAYETPKDRFIKKLNELPQVLTINATVSDMKTHIPYLKKAKDYIPGFEKSNYDKYVNKLELAIAANTPLSLTRDEAMTHLNYLKMGETRYFFSKEKNKEFLKNKRKLDLAVLQNPHISIIKSGEKYTAKIPYLLPNKSYELMFKKRLSPKELDIFLKLYNMDNAGKLEKDKRKFYNAAIFGLEAPTNNPYQEFYLNSQVPVDVGFIRLRWEDFNKTNGVFKNLKNKLDTQFLIINNSYSYNVPTLTDIQAVGQLVRQYKLDEKTHSWLNFVSSATEIENIAKGLKVFGNHNQAATDINSFTKRYANIKISLENTTKLENQLYTLVSIENGLITNHFIDHYFKDLKEHIKNSKEAFDTILNESSELLNDEFSFAELVGATSIHKEMKTNNGQVIVPDFGLINIIADRNDGNIQYVPRPYVGVNFHFGGGIDRNLRIRDIPKGSRNRFWLRSSISLGVTIGKIDENGFSDFYNGFSPAVGYNWRVDDQIRLGGGVLLLREKNKNEFLDKNSVEPALYFNLSFDFSLFETLGKAAVKLVGI